MKNIHILPTDKPSRLHSWTDENGSRLELCDLEYSHTRNTQNIYITNSEEIKEGDWYLGFETNYSTEPKERWVLYNCVSKPNGDYSEKIILTTDQDLFKDGVQAIDDEFLEWFVENPNCEEVEIYQGKKDYGTFQWYSEYKIIIPKEETEISKEEPINCPKCRTPNFKNCHSIHCPMRKKEPKQTVQEYEQQGLEKYPHELESKQEALEEAANKWVFEINGNKWSNNDNTAGDNYGSFITGAKWQQERMYSEEYLVELLNFVTKEYNISNGIGWFHTHDSIEDVSSKEVLEQFKKKV